MSEKTCIELAREARELRRNGHLYEAGEKYEAAGDCTMCKTRRSFYYDRAVQCYADNETRSHG